MAQNERTSVPAIRPLPRPVPLRQSVYDALIDLIVGGELPPGQHMVETDLAQQLGVSRQPIREALHRMEAEGWVDLRPSQGAFVHVPTNHEVDDLLDVRALLEGETARLAARAANPAQVAKLREIWTEGQAAAEEDDYARAVAANDSFHAQIAAIAGNSALAELADIVGRRVRWYYRMVAAARSHGSWVEHQEMIDAIEAADAERAQLLARRHTERTRAAYHGALSEVGIITICLVVPSASGSTSWSRRPDVHRGGRGAQIRAPIRGPFARLGPVAERRPLPPVRDSIATRPP